MVEVHGYSEKDVNDVKLKRVTQLQFDELMERLSFSPPKLADNCEVMSNTLEINYKEKPCCSKNMSNSVESAKEVRERLLKVSQSALESFHTRHGHRSKECCFCDKTWVSNSAKNSHLESHHLKLKNKCPKCPRTFSVINRSHFYVHLDTDHGVTRNDAKNLKISKGPFQIILLS